MPARDDTAWAPVQGDHGDDITYTRLRQNPVSQPTDEQRTADELEATAEYVEAQPEQPADVAPEENEAGVGDYNATAAAIELASQLGVDLSTVTGTGADGKITKPDVEAAAA